MYYPGDTYTFTIFITTPTGAAPTVTTAPTIQIINAGTGATMLGSAGTMTLIAGTTAVYTYVWNIPTGAKGKYVAVASYVANGNTFSSFPFESVSIGDSYISGSVALNATVAKDGTVAKDSTVAHLTDLATISPNTSTVVLAIKAKTDLLPSIPAAQSDVQAVQADTDFIKGMVAADMSVNRNVIPRTLTYTYNGVVLATYTLTDDSNSSGRTQI